jgi:hypothetical protein
MFAFEIGPLELLLGTPFALAFAVWLWLQYRGPRR